MISFYFMITHDRFRHQNAHLFNNLDFHFCAKQIDSHIDCTLCTHIIPDLFLSVEHVFYYFISITKGIFIKEIFTMNPLRGVPAFSRNYRSVHFTVFFIQLV